MSRSTRLKTREFLGLPSIKLLIRVEILLGILTCSSNCIPLLPLKLKLQYILNRLKEVNFNIEPILNFTYDSDFYKKIENRELLNSILGQEANFSRRLTRK